MPKAIPVHAPPIQSRRRPRIWLSAVVENARIATYLVICFLLLLAWIIGFIVFRLAGALIHILLILALISLVLHFVRGSRTDT